VAESGGFRVQAIVSSDDGGHWSPGPIIDEGANSQPLNDSHGVAVNGQNHILVAQTEDPAIFEYANVPPALTVLSGGNFRSYVKDAQAIRLAVRYNQLDKKCVGALKATVTVPPNAAHVFTVKGNATITDHFKDVELDLSDRQLKWLKQAWHAGHRVPVKGKATGDCSGGFHLSDTTDFKI
jgi:hypothetical protein